VTTFEEFCKLLRRQNRSDIASASLYDGAAFSYLERCATGKRFENCLNQFSRLRDGNRAECYKRQRKFACQPSSAPYRVVGLRTGERVDTLGFQRLIKIPQLVLKLGARRRRLSRRWPEDSIPA
jgi:hypothetical protein